MATISYNGQSFIIDGRPVWLVSGAVHYARTPRELWRSRIRAAKQAGLNCIDTYVFWNLHETAPKRFTFDGDRDLRAFIEMIGAEGMYCILRPGPYIGSAWDFGGLPAWLHRLDELMLRQDNEPFKQACARYLGKVMDQVRDLQVAPPGAGAAAVKGAKSGPIIAMQIENRWFCHNPEQEEPYLRPLLGYLRQNGCTVPVIEANNLWQPIDGAIPAWDGNEHIAATMREMRIVQPDVPRLNIGHLSGSHNTWGTSHEKSIDASTLMTRLAGVLAVGAQFNVDVFHGGTNFGFHAGRTVQSDLKGFNYVTTSHDFDAPLGEAGARGDKYHAVKRLCTFASSFGNVFANLSAEAQHSAAAIEDTLHGVSVVHQNGSQGDVVFVFRGAAGKSEQVTVMLPTGQRLPVPLGDDPVAWFVLGVPLPGSAVLDYTNLRPWTIVDDRMIVLFGPAGSEGLISISDAAMTVRVPTGGKPVVEKLEDHVVVVLNEEQVGTTYATGDALIIGAAGLDDDDQPFLTPGTGSATITTIASSGKVTNTKLPAVKKPVAPKLGDWQQADLDALLDGTSAAYDDIEGAESLEELKCDQGYGWYHVRLQADALANLRNSDVLAPAIGDRVHMFVDGQPLAMLGRGPDAKFAPAKLKLGESITLLADNLGRFSDGWAMGELKGVFGDLVTVRPASLGRMKMLEDTAPDALMDFGFLHDVDVEDVTPSDILVWEFKPANRMPMVLDISDLPYRTIVYMNRAPLLAYDPVLSGRSVRMLLEPGREITGGKNEMRFALYGEYDRGTNIKKHVQLYQTTRNLTAKAQWRFTPWSPPPAGDFGPRNPQSPRRPRWYRATFEVDHTGAPLWLAPRGMSKGQIFLNGHNVGRYWVQTKTGKPMPPQSRYYLPEPWLHTDKENELLLFDEHGNTPARCSLIYNQGVK